MAKGRSSKWITRLEAIAKTPTVPRQMSQWGSGHRQKPSLQRQKQIVHHLRIQFVTQIHLQMVGVVCCGLMMIRMGQEGT